jgi:5-formyltetrahydrofolate cyclo-ligase
VPGVCFDLQGNRMGYGGGFYDRFLQQTAAIKIAPAYSFQVLNTIPTETHDITMDIIITPQGMVHP